VNGASTARSWILAPQAGLTVALHDVAAKLDSSSRAPPRLRRWRATRRRCRVWDCGAVGDTDTIGWARYSLDQRHIPYIYVRDEDIRAGKLRERYDVLLYGHVDLELAEQIQGIPGTWGPMPFKKTGATPSLGTPAESDDITGASAGADSPSCSASSMRGTPDHARSGSMLPLEAGMVRACDVNPEGYRAARRGRRGGRSGITVGGHQNTRAHVRVSFARPDHPIAYGYSARTHVFRQNFPSTPFRATGCAWRTARPVSTAGRSQRRGVGVGDRKARRSS